MAIEASERRRRASMSAREQRMRRQRWRTARRERARARARGDRALLAARPLACACIRALSMADRYGADAAAAVAAVAATAVQLNICRSRVRSAGRRRPLTVVGG